jgi:1A family penicillin-binding protein
MRNVMKRRPINNLYNIDKKTKTDYENSQILFMACKRIFLIAFGLIFFISLLITIYFGAALKELPDVSILDEYSPDLATQIFDKNNVLVANIYGDEDRTDVSLSQIAPALQWAVISVEDNRFYKHSGVDFVGTVRAMLNNLMHRDSVQGGSTLTQQLVKNSLLTPQRSIKRKLIEAVLAAKIELKYSKKEILEKYLNRIYWGNYSYGIEKAARKYFGKSAKSLNLSESALLAGLIKAPEFYSPYSNLEEAKERQKIVLDKMYEFKYITKEQRDKAYAEPLKLVPKKFTYGKYIYFVDYVAYNLRQKYGDNIVRRGGLRVYTTLDPRAQLIAEKTISEGVKALSKSTGIQEGALISIDVKTASIQALVGGVDYSKSQFNRAVLAKRPIGSGFKPVVYLAGIRTGVINPDSIIYDTPVFYRTKWNVWCPHNWDGKYMGKMTIMQALTLSRNTPTVRIALRVGVDKIIETARLLGIKSYIRHGFSMVLGSSEITPLEVATVYSTLARDGIYIEPTAIRYVKDSKGNILESNYSAPTRVVSSEFVRELNSILVNVVEKGTGRSAKLADRQVAGKTGTTDNVRDIWFNGFTPDTATIIWMGNDRNLPLKGVFSSNCATLWSKFTTEYYKVSKIPPQKFPISEFQQRKAFADELAHLKETLNDENLSRLSRNKPKKVINKIKNYNEIQQQAKNTKKIAEQKNKSSQIKENSEDTESEYTGLPERTYVPDENNYENRYNQDENNMYTP